ncbi:uncharacterized protein HaLaN_23259 [Haematococcus lacustris]|uniref:Uncharacterized protein n=1 Tax=Haematococcus lacustris TaxID=44745 RepID=A0A699ZZP5_HAELA|nr:uncharacterized protein HaLaN_23259 [Haematococcus lacustris]
MEQQSVTWVMEALAGAFELRGPISALAAARAEHLPPAFVPGESKQPGSSQSESEQQQLRKEFESLLQTLVKPAETLSKEDIKRLKEAAFGPQTFWVTETQTISEAERTGLLIRGNLRDERAKVYEHISAKPRVMGLWKMSE